MLSPLKFRQDLVLLWFLALLFAGTYLLFRPGLTGPFVFDDLSNISHLAIIGGDLTPERLSAYLYSFSGSLGRPLSALSFLINDAAWPTDPEPFKYTNLLFHLVNGLLVFLLVLRLTSQLPNYKSRFVAMAATAMWLLAPSQVASVMLTVQRMALLSALFTLAGLVLHVRSIQMSNEMGPLRAFVILARLALFTFLAFLCKENGALLPLFAVCLHATVLRASLPNNANARRMIVLGAAAPWILVGLYLLTHPGYVTQGYGTGRDFSLVQRLMTEARVLWSYLGNILLPKIGEHGIFHDDYIVSDSLLQPATTLLSVVGWMVIAPLAVLMRRAFPWFAFATLWFLVGHLMESTVISLEIYFEHRNYVAMLGPLLLLGIGFSTFRPRIAWLLLLVWLAFAAIATASNAKVWGSAETMAAVWFSEHPNSVRAIQMRASTLASRGLPDDAITILEDGYRRLPEKGELLFQTLPLRCGNGTMTREQLPSYIAAASMVETPQIPANQLADLRHATLNCGGEFSLSDWWALTDALLANPRMQVSRNALAHLHYQRGQAAVAERNLDLAMSELDLSYEAEPNPFIPQQQARYLLSAGLYEDALFYLDKSEQTHVSFWKKWIFDAKSMNSRLRSSITSALDEDSKQG